MIYKQYLKHNTLFNSLLYHNVETYLYIQPVAISVVAKLRLRSYINNIRSSTWPYNIIIISYLSQAYDSSIVVTWSRYKSSYKPFYIHVHVYILKIENTGFGVCHIVTFTIATLFPIHLKPNVLLLYIIL